MPTVTQLKLSVLILSMVFIQLGCKKNSNNETSTKNAPVVQDSAQYSLVQTYTSMIGGTRLWGRSYVFSPGDTLATNSDTSFAITVVNDTTLTVDTLSYTHPGYVYKSPAFVFTYAGNYFYDGVDANWCDTNARMMFVDKRIRGHGGAILYYYFNGDSVVIDNSFGGQGHRYKYYWRSR